MFDSQPAPGYEDFRFEIAEGEGEPALFGQRLELRRVTADGFRGELAGYGAAWLMEITNDPNPGLLVAITSRSASSIEEQLAKWQHATVVVHRLDELGESGSAAGMAGLHLVPPTAPTSR